MKCFADVDLVVDVAVGRREKRNAPLLAVFYFFDVLKEEGWELGQGE